MSTWTIVELKKDAFGIEVITHSNLANARDDFFDRYNKAKADGSNILNFELDKDGPGVFDTNGITVWLTEAPMASVTV